MIILLILSFFSPLITTATDTDHLYNLQDKVHLYFNKVGPYHNPQETYTYFSLPFCGGTPGEEGGIKYAGLGEVLEGHGFVHSGMDLSFRDNQIDTRLCTKTLNENDATIFQHAILHHYWYQMYIDDLPVWGMVGEIYDHPILNENDAAIKDTKEDSAKPAAITLSKQEAPITSETEQEDASYKLYVYTRKKFSIAYNQHRIIEVNLTSEDPRLVEVGATLDFNYDVQWIETKATFEKRFERYLDYSFFEHQIHWFSIFNSFMMVIFLVGLVSLILIRTLRNDYAKYMRDEEDLDETERGVGEESGWKQVHGDIFRSPPYLTLFTALYGAGHQLLVLFLLLIFLSIAGSLYVERGAIVTTFIICYGLTSTWSGYTSGAFYKQHYYRESPGWKIAMAATASLIPVVTLSVLFVLNGISIAYGTHSIPTTAAISLLLLWLFVAVPLTVAGTLLGRHMNPNASWPCRVHAIPGLVPEHPWYRQRLVIALLSGLLPFGSIFIEM